MDRVGASTNRNNLDQARRGAAHLPCPVCGHEMPAVGGVCSRCGHRAAAKLKHSPLGIQVPEQHQAQEHVQLAAQSRYFNGVIDAVEGAGCRFFRELHPPGAPLVWIDGEGPYVNMGSNCAGAFNTHPVVKERVKEAVDIDGVGICAPPALCGVTSLRRQLERRMAALHGTEDDTAGVLFNDGVSANIGALGALLSSGGKSRTEPPLVASDAENHASIIMGLKLAGAQVLVYRDVDDLERQLAQCRQRPEMIVTDGVFSMSGRIADLTRILTLARDLGGVPVFVDDAHGLGVLGPGGRGSVAHLGLEPAGDLVVMNTLSKFLGSSGAVVTGPSHLVRWIAYFSKNTTFSTSLATPAVAGALAALELMTGEEGSEIQQQLWANRQYLYDALVQLGYEELMGPTQTHIVPIRVPDRLLGPAHQCMLEHRVWAPPIPSASRAATSRLRLVVSAGHRRRDLDQVIGGLASLAPLLLTS